MTSMNDQSGVEREKMSFIYAMKDKIKNRENKNVLEGGYEDQKGRVITKLGNT